MVSVRPRVERLAVLALQVGLLGVLAVGLAGGSASVTVHAALSLLVTLLPAVLRRDFRIHVDVELALFVTVAVFLHAVGMLGLYDDVWWWDHLTHTLSAMVVAGAGYTVFRAVDEHSDAVEVPRRRLSVYVFAFTMAMGLLWEGLELGARVASEALGIGVIWVHYGPTDTVLDLAFDAVGALIVALFLTPRLRGTVETLRLWLDRRFGTE
jgi:hypothetical protein